MPRSHSPAETAVAGEIAAAIGAQAEFTAWLVHRFLDSLGVVATPDKPVQLPAWFLLDLGTAVQIARWEQTGAIAHLPEPFPAARGLLKALFAAAADPHRAPGREPETALGARVMAAHVHYFAHRATPDSAAVVLTRPDPDALVDALAQYLWKTRSLSAPTAPEPGDQ